MVFGFLNVLAAGVSVCDFDAVAFALRGDWFCVDFMWLAA